MKCHLLYLSYNNYFNRIIKKELSLQEYLAYNHALRENVAFNPNDGIETSIVVNWQEEKFIPDYCIVISLEGSILSKWFITDFVRTRSGQFSASLKRDVISDHYDEVINAPCFIEKGFVYEDNPLIFNKEDFDCNQIKKSETLLHDYSCASYIVLYYDLKAKTKEDSPLKGSVSTIAEPYFDTEASSLEEWSIYEKYASGFKQPVRRDINVFVELAGRTDELRLTFDSTLLGVSSSETGIQSDTELSNTNRDLNEVYEQTILCIRSNAPTIKTYRDQFGNPDNTLNYIYSFNGKIIKCGNDYYRMYVGENVTNISETTTLVSGNLYDALCAAFKQGDNFKYDFEGGFVDAFSIKVHYQKYSLRFEKITEGVTTYKYDFTNCVDVQDQPYGILCLPYKGKDNYDLWYNDTRKIPDNLSILIAREMCKSGVGNDKDIYDAQILPYCPLNLQSNWDDNRRLVYLSVSALDNSQYTDITLNDGVTPVSFGLHPTSSKFSKPLYFSLSTNNLKVENQCKFYRIVSPNYSGQFEFNVARNGGSVALFEADCTYKPFQPYIHIAPVFKGLYGADFNDARGLICGGDFSLSLISQAFETYKLQNKNYQDIFNRQIENMDVNYNIEQKYNLINTIEKEVASGAALIGGTLMGHPAAALGGGVGLVGSAASGYTNMFKNKEVHQEARDYAIDNHNFKLGNIKALPNSIAKVDSYNNNNKVFPILEEYSCTDEEIAIFEDKIKYEGMTINAIGKIKDYVETNNRTFVKGKMIRIEDLAEDSHLLYVIYDEISKGVYL